LPYKEERMIYIRQAEDCLPYAKITLYLSWEYLYP